MQVGVLSVEDFVSDSLNNSSVVIDVRSEGEFEKAHFPGALNVPLLNNEHRKLIGTLYKQQGREVAIQKGFEVVGPLFHSLIQECIRVADNRVILFYCWRGGMRSNIMAWLLQTAGAQVKVLKGGYKAYRNWVLTKLEQPQKIIIIDGKTGSGKTELLHRLQEKGEQIIDLEGLANHKGSSFGSLGQPDQPSQEHFENLLGYHLAACDSSKVIWMENESKSIGKIFLPVNFYKNIKCTLFVELLVDKSIRNKRLEIEYGCFTTDELIECTERLTKRMGGQHVKAAIENLRLGNKTEWIDLLLTYYDKNYEHGKLNNNPSERISLEFDWQNVNILIEELINISKKYN
jgi:tRNA 2-selenouridine synthase